MFYYLQRIQEDYNAKQPEDRDDVPNTESEYLNLKIEEGSESYSIFNPS